MKVRYPKNGAGRIRRTGATPKIARDINKHTFRKLIVKNEEYHKENAMKWSEKQDWDALRDEFSSPHSNSSRRFYYVDIDQFAQHKCKGNEDHYRWIIKSIGPIPKKEIVWQGDWAAERLVEHSRDVLLAETLTKQLQKDTGLFEIASRVASSYRTYMDLPNLMRSAVMKYLGGVIVEDHPKNWSSMDKKARDKWRAKQRERLDFFSGWINRIIETKDRIDSAYLKTIGATKETLPQVINNIILAKANGNGNGNHGEVNGRESDAARLLAGLMGMEMAKAKAFDQPLPEEYQQQIDDAIEVEVQK